MANSTTRIKPAKPHKDFPLFSHANGSWAKKIRGKLHYFGPWDDPDGALNRWLDVKDDLLAGRTPRVHHDGLTIKDLCNRYLLVKHDLVQNGELSPRTFRDNKDTTDLVVLEFGKDRLVDDLAADDFEKMRRRLAKTRGPVNLGNTIQRVRGVFRYGFEAGLIEKPVRYGPHFKRPSAKVMRQQRHKNGEKMFSAAEIRAILDTARPQLKAMVLLGINCGFGNSDCGTLPRSAIDLDGGWVDYPRPKTAVPRRCPLWPETVQALREALQARPQPKDNADHDKVFITKHGSSWHKDTPDNPIAKEMKKVLNTLGLRRRGVGFYALRHTFETVAGETIDQVGVDHIMGHAPASSDMSSVYRERISDDRLHAVTEYVRTWLFTGEGGAK